MLVSRYYNESRAALRTYPGFKLFIATVYLASLVLVTATEAWHHGVNDGSWEFVKGYWFADRLRYFELFLLVGTFCAVFLTDVLRPLHQRQFGRYRQEAVPFGWVTAGKVLGCLSLVCAVYVVPFLNLHIPTLVLNVGKVAWATSAVLPYFSFFKGEELGGAVPSLAHSSFDRLYFDVAALAPLRSPIVEQINECLERCEKGPSDPETQNFIRNGQRGTPWGGLDDLFSRLANFFGVGPESVTIHERTTSSLAFALDEIVRNRMKLGLSAASVLTTDIEYPGIIGDLLPEFERQGALQILQKQIRLKHLICSGASRERIQDAIVSVSRDANPDVVLISHVYYATGYVLDLEPIFRSFQSSKKPVFVIDGAQSVGNIDVSARTLQQVEYYAAGAHKWLMVPRHIGLLFRNRELLETVHKFTHFEAINRPDSSFPVQSAPFSVTISYEPYFGLSVMLRDEFQPLRMTNIASHNRRLAEVFRNEILALGYRPIGDDNQSSIISVSFGTITEQLQRSLQSSGVKCKFLKIESEGETIHAIRFCFHFYHSKDDVFRLLDSIESEVIRVRS